MKLLSVNVWTLDKHGDGPKKLGEIHWDGYDITVSDPNVIGLKIAFEPAILIDQSVIDPNKEPEKFMRSLYLSYYSPAFHCSRATEPKAKAR